VEEEGLLSVFHELWFAGFDDPCRACIARFSDAYISCCYGSKRRHLHFSQHDW